MKMDSAMENKMDGGKDDAMEMTKKHLKAIPKNFKAKAKAKKFIPFKKA